MKQYFTGFFTGAFLVASAVMFMGATKGKVGKYQGFVHNGIHLLDTETGQLWKNLGENWWPSESIFLNKPK